MTDDPRQTDLAGLLADVAARTAAFRAGLDERPVKARADLAELRRALGGPLPDRGTPAAAVVDELARAAEPGVVASAGPRYFGFVVGGSLPAALAADWLAAGWDQNAGLHVVSPAAAVAEEVASDWLRELFGLPAGCSAAFVTGGQMANFVGLAAARHHVLAHAGWDVEADGLVAAPPVRVLVGQRRHATIDTALRMLGFGAARSLVIAADEQGRMRIDALEEAVAGERGPTIVCTQVGEVNSGAFDPVGELADVAHTVEAWVHVDGAFGLWAAASPALRHLVAGVERADSWSTDGHKWLNVPYDSGFAFTRHPESHRAAFASQAAYLLRPGLGPDGSEPREPDDWVPELSRRARGFAVWAALRSLGREGVADLVDRCCRHARRFAERLAAAPDVEVLDDVVLNQVLVRFGGSDTHTGDVIRRVQDDGTCWVGGTEWNGRAAMRISVSSWLTTADDVDRSAAAILDAHRATTTDSR